MKNNQKARDNVTQISINNANLGLTEREVMSIINKEKEMALISSKLVAEETARNRLDEFSNVLIPRLVRSEVLSAFSDPVIQFSFRNAEKTAVCTDRECDYELLSELLIHKINRKDDYTKSAAIEKAISEVNNISEEALMVLTLMFAVQTYLPKSGIMSKGIKAMDKLYGKILTNFPLNISNDWIDNLDITNCIRLNPMSTYNKMEDVLIKQFNGYAVKGINRNSENYQKAIQLLTKSNLPLIFLVNNEFSKDYTRLQLVNKNVGNAIDINMDKFYINIELNEEQKKCIKDVFDLYEDIDEDINKKYIDLLNKNENIVKLITWWNKTLMGKPYMAITPIGKVLAHTNAKRIDNTLPDLN